MGNRGDLMMSDGTRQVLIAAGLLAAFAALAALVRLPVLGILQGPGCWMVLDALEVEHEGVVDLAIVLPQRLRHRVQILDDGLQSHFGHSCL